MTPKHDDSGKLVHAVRRASQDDLPFLWQMLALSAYATVEEAKADNDISMYLEGWKRKGDIGFIAIDKTAKPLGAAWVRNFEAISSPFHFIPRASYQLVIAVLPQGRGVGSMLLDALLHHLDQNCPIAISLNVREKNRAVKFYEAHGFRTEAKIVNRVGSTSLIMVRERPAGTGVVQ